MTEEKVSEIDNPISRAKRVTRYKHMMADTEATRLNTVRSEIVRRYRSHPATYPDGIDTKYDRWYRPEEWTDQGEYLGPKHNPSVQDILDRDTRGTDSPPITEPDSLEARIDSLLKQNHSIRDIAKTLNISVGKAQRIKAKLTP